MKGEILPSVFSFFAKMFISTSVKGIPIRLTNERWTHIMERHPELRTEKNKILETISNPDFVQEGDWEEFIAIKYYRKTPLTSKYLLVVYKEISEIDGFVITSYFTAKPAKWRRLIWHR